MQYLGIGIENDAETRPSPLASSAVPLPVVYYGYLTTRLELCGAH